MSGCVSVCVAQALCVRCDASVRASADRGSWLAGCRVLVCRRSLVLSRLARLVCCCSSHLAIRRACCSFCSNHAAGPCLAPVGHASSVCWDWEEALRCSTLHAPAPTLFTTVRPSIHAWPRPPAGLCLSLLSCCWLLLLLPVTTTRSPATCSSGRALGLARAEPSTPRPFHH